MDMQFDEEDKAFFAKLEQQVQELTDREVLLKSKTLQPIDKEAISKAKREQLTSELNSWLDGQIRQCAPLGELLKQDAGKIYEKLKENSLDQETLRKSYSDYPSIKRTKDRYKNLLAPEEIKELAGIGNRYFKEGDYDKAYLYFLFLTFLEPSNEKHHLLKGMSEQNRKNYAEAIQSYFMATTLDPNQLLAYLQIVECLILSKNIEEAKQIYATIAKEVDVSQDDAFYSSKMKIIESHLS